MKTKKEKFDYHSIKSFEDACNKEGLNPNALPDVSMIPDEFRAAIINMYKLYIIYKAINDGWVADYANPSQRKWYPWFWVGSSGSGFGLSLTAYGYGYSRTTVGSRLCTFSEESARYIADTFTQEYTEIFLIQK
jgi:hypothetical protein